MNPRHTNKATHDFPDLGRFKSYEQLKTYADKYGRNWSGEQNWACVEKMRQLRHGYKPGELKMDKSKIEVLTIEDFRERSEKEYAEEIKKYGPR